MAPKQQKTKEQVAGDKTRQKEKEQKAADKTFGMKNKNKSKAVQMQIKQINSAAKGESFKKAENKQHDEKTKKEATAKQAALLAGLFNMATDKKGRVFDPSAKKKAKEKNMEEERSGANVDAEIQQVLVDGIKNAIRLSNPKGTNLSTIGGSIYVRDVLDDTKYEKKLKDVTVLHFIRRRVNDFWIAEDDAENSNPTCRCKEDVDSENSEDDRAIYMILEEKRAEFSNPSLPRVIIKDLRAFWKKSAELEYCRDPETGMIDPELRDKPKPKKKLTGEELFKLDPSMFTMNADGSAVKVAGGEGTELDHAFQAELSKKQVVQKKEEENAEEDSEDEEDKEEFMAGREWGAMDSEEEEEESGKPVEQPSSSSTAQVPAQSPGKPKAVAKAQGARKFSPPERSSESKAPPEKGLSAAVSDLPNDLDALDDTED